MSVPLSPDPRGGSTACLRKRDAEASLRRHSLVGLGSYRSRRRRGHRAGGGGGHREGLRGRPGVLQAPPPSARSSPPRRRPVAGQFTWRWPNELPNLRRRPLPRSSRPRSRGSSGGGTGDAAARAAAAVGRARRRSTSAARPSITRPTRWRRLLPASGRLGAPRTPHQRRGDGL